MCEWTRPCVVPVRVSVFGNEILLHSQYSKPAVRRRETLGATTTNAENVIKPSFAELEFQTPNSEPCELRTICSPPFLWVCVYIYVLGARWGPSVCACVFVGVCVRLRVCEIYDKYFCTKRAPLQPEEESCLAYMRKNNRIIHKQRRRSVSKKRAQNYVHAMDTTPNIACV